ncbi:DUF2145 domain-containing protein [Lonsdalea populi]|uniref:DUF2145 domain-containing protein n=1 Tax=Lonsdalea populi TaxID=1172565 RepID=A0A3N0U7M4_9GAMM|nr:DUF2145 domain-containing protein [Lonsdalea populi]ROH78134.1 DUF2145 domain-containing protein [Lonsdalea populi]ROH78670.1 DUF2145 domain-containing protein [Lonsdalea populi]
MASLTIFRLVCLIAAIGTSLHAQDEIFASSASSASSAESASRGSVSDSLSGSNDSSEDDEKTSGGNYQIFNVGDTPNRTGCRRVTLQGNNTRRNLVLDLPLAVFDKQGLEAGDAMLAQQRVYGLEFAHGDTRKAFYLVLADHWHDDLAARQLYYTRDEGCSRIYDQGLAGDVMGTENGSLGYIQGVRFPAGAAQKLSSAALDSRLALRLLATDYSANACAFGLDNQNCNQWVMELLAVA